MLYADLLVSLQQGNVKKSEKLMKIVKTDRENLHIFLTASVISMTFSEKMWLTTKLSHKKPMLYPLFRKHPLFRSHRGLRVKLHLDSFKD